MSWRRERQHGRGRLPRSSTTACAHYGFSFSATASIFKENEVADGKFTRCDASVKVLADHCGVLRRR